LVVHAVTRGQCDDVVEHIESVLLSEADRDAAHRRVGRPLAVHLLDGLTRQPGRPLRQVRWISGVLIDGRTPPTARLRCTSGSRREMATARDAKIDR
jgi:hypothetical protein